MALLTGRAGSLTGRAGSLLPLHEYISRQEERASTLRLIANVSASSIDLLSTPLPLSDILDQFVRISAAAAGAGGGGGGGGGAGLPCCYSARSARPDLRPSVFSSLSLRRPSVSLGRYCSASGRDADLSALIRQPPDGAILLHHDTALTGLVGGEGGANAEDERRRRL